MGGTKRWVALSIVLIGVAEVGIGGASTATHPISWLAAGDSYESGQGLTRTVEPCAQGPGPWDSGLLGPLWRGGSLPRPHSPSGSPVHSHIGRGEGEYRLEYPVAGGHQEQPGQVHVVVGGQGGKRSLGHESAAVRTD